MNINIDNALNTSKDKSKSKTENNKKGLLDSKECNTYIGIYVHIPFCKSKCSYCDFLSFNLNNEYMKKEYFKAIKKEISDTILKIDYLNNINRNKSIVENINEETNINNFNNLIVDTIYIGGGTPSSVDPKYIKEIIDEIKSEFYVLDDVEITIEVNPESVNEENLKLYSNIGINRISIGLQTTNDLILKRLGRLYTYSEFKDKYNLIRKYFKNINIDLMFGLPNQSLDDVKKDIEELIYLNPNHISTYSLILEENTKLYKEYKNKEIILPEDILNRDMYWYIKKSLEKAGYIQYEISNFSKDSYESKHNINCWKQKYYLGYGIGAASYFNNIRFSNISNLPLYIDNINNKIIDINIEEIQDIESMQKEYVLLALRMNQGLSIKSFIDKFNIDSLVLFEDKINKLINNNLITINQSDNDVVLKLTDKGLDLANLVWEEFI